MQSSTGFDGFAASFIRKEKAGKGNAPSSAVSQFCFCRVPVGFSKGKHDEKGSSMFRHPMGMSFCCGRFGGHQNLVEVHVVCICIDGCIDECMDGWMGGWMDGWMDGWIDVNVCMLPDSQKAQTSQAIALDPMSTWRRIRSVCHPISRDSLLNGDTPS